MSGAADGLSERARCVCFSFQQINPIPMIVTTQPPLASGNGRTTIKAMLQITTRTAAPISSQSRWRIVRSNSCIFVFIIWICCPSEIAEPDGSGCCCQSFLRASSFMAGLIRQRREFLLDPVQHHSNVVGADAHDRSDLLIAQV